MCTKFEISPVDYAGPPCRNITKIESDTGEMLINKNDINNDILQFYSNLYVLRT